LCSWARVRPPRQDELGPSALEDAFKDQIAKTAAEGTWTEQTERILLAAARVGQHVFALNVLANCGGRCVFCGLNPGSFGAKRMLVAGHIKPWKDSTSAECLDLRHGLAACPSHDVVFDTGLLTVDVSLQVHVSGALAGAVRADPLARHYCGRPPLRDTILLPDQAQLPGRKYLVWHRTNIFVA
jgi:putative restriction endonuclease